MDQLTARELINNGWFVISLCLVIVFTGFLLKEMKEDGWYAKLRNKAAFALLAYFSGETVARGWTVLLLSDYVRTQGQGYWAIEQRYPIALLGAGISFLAAICCVRVFSPPSWGHSAWVIVVVIAAVFMALTYFY